MESTSSLLEEVAQAYEYQKNYESKVAEAAAYIHGVIRTTTSGPPEFGIVLGSGLGSIADEIKECDTIDYECIPNFPKTTVAGHAGKLIAGLLKGVPVIGLQGRKHYYEVADVPFNTGMLQVVFPVHVLAELGVRNYFATNAAGGLNEKYNRGDIMVIDTHINMIKNPLLGRKHTFETAGHKDTPRFTPMDNEYDRKLTDLLEEAARRANYDPTAGSTHRGTYLAVTGPSYETKGECRMFRQHADAIGMSTAPEIITARNRGMKCVGMSLITNKIAADGTNATNHEEVQDTSRDEKTRKKLCSTVRTFFTIYRDAYKHL